LRIYAKKEVFSKSRILKGLTQRELARQSGLSHAYISMVERSVKSVGPGAAKRLSELLDKDAEELFKIE
jgi:putative transcriptional regulator